MFDQTVLREVGILEFIHQHVDKSPRVFLAHGREIFQQARGVDEQVVEVHGVAGDESLLIFDVNALDHFVAVIGDWVIVRAEQIVLGFRDRAVNARGPIQLVVQIELFDDALDNAFLVVRVEDDEVAFHGQVFGLAAQQPRADGVERAEHHPLRGFLAEQGLDAVFHFPRGLVGERHRQDLVGTDSLGRDQVGDALGQHARLAGARSREDEDRSRPGCDGFSLWSVEFVEEVHEEKR